MGRKIVVTSGKGGVGKTTVTANLAYFLALLGERVVAVDCDVGLNNLDVALGIEGRISYDLFDCFEGRCRVKQALVQSPWHKNLFVLPACFGKDRSAPPENAIKKVAEELDRSFGYVLLDCPAGAGTDFRRAVMAAEEALVIVTPHLSSIRDADKVINYLSGANLKAVNLVVNKMRGDLAVSGEILSPKEIADLLKISLIGTIPEDDGISSCLSLGGGRSGKAFSFLSGNVCYGQRRIYDCTGRYTGLIGSIRRKLKKIL